MYPRLFHIYGPLWIQSYGVMIALGFLTFLYISFHHPLRKKIISQELYLNGVFAGLISGLIGGRLLYVITNYHEFAGRWIEIFFPWVGGLIVLGSIIGVIIGTASYCWFNTISMLPLFDLAALHAPLMQAIARLGCLFAGCCYGAYASNMWWAITFRDPHAFAPLHIPLHPTQLYMSVVSFAIFIVLYILSPRLLKRHGSLFGLYLVLENVARFAIDFWRGDRYNLIGPFLGTIKISHAQVYSLIGLVISMIIFVILWSRKTANHR